VLGPWFVPARPGRVGWARFMTPCVDTDAHTDDGASRAGRCGEHQTAAHMAKVARRRTHQAVHEGGLRAKSGVERVYIESSVVQACNKPWRVVPRYKRRGPKRGMADSTAARPALSLPLSWERRSNYRR